MGWPSQCGLAEMLTPRRGGVVLGAGNPPALASWACPSPSCGSPSGFCFVLSENGRFGIADLFSSILPGLHQVKTLRTEVAEGLLPGA